MALKKIFSGSEILASGLQQKLEAINIFPVVRNNLQAARVSGFGNSGMAVELFIEEREFVKAEAVIDDFKMNL
ncbi:DUF2007 domain-containing protein [Flavobacterium jejuense]|uniref:DUF2007 domain-containing protein n=1 Tax=Flavobacterium jejuense TaxID=1544455 RepID=A0ABX0IMY5_9FLAO|nr:DUF2007 domain-containing protein [Flavobacterium jejuense]NHN25073.1 DUF2007 domain-containing protein [Flavobacterium jejuense]